MAKEITYHRAAYLDNYFGGRKFGVRFEEGPHKGEIYHEDECKIALDDAERIEKRRNENNAINLSRSGAVEEKLETDNS